MTENLFQNENYKAMDLSSKQSLKVRKTSMAYLLIVLSQGLHSLEEYTGRLWENFPPATFLCSLISDDLRTGFLIINIGLFVLGFAFWFFIVRHNYSYSNVIVWVWIGIEMINGVGHPIWSLMQKAYTPGLLTAPLLLLLSIYLIRLKTKKNYP